MLSACLRLHGSGLILHRYGLFPLSSNQASFEHLLLLDGVLLVFQFGLLLDGEVIELFD